MLNNLLNSNTLLKALIVFTAAEVFSLAAYEFNDLNWLLLPIFIILGIWLINKSSRWIIYLPLAEIAWGSLGRSFAWDLGGFDLSLRMLIFLLLTFWWLIHWQQYRKIYSARNTYLKIWLFAIIMIIYGAVLGTINGYSLTNVFNDANGYYALIYFLYWLPIYKSEWLSDIVAIITAAAIVVAVKTIIIFHLFTHNYFFANLQYLYIWLRDTRVGELTPLAENYWRIFFQSHIYVALVWLLGIVNLTITKSKLFTWPQFIIWSVLFSAVLVSLSRSIWLALFIFLIIWLIVGFRQWWSSDNKGKKFVLIIASVFSSVVIIFLVLFIPPNGPINLSNIFTSRINSPNEAAASSRMVLLPVMLNSIKQHPLIGSGFGKELQFATKDPRQLAVVSQQGYYQTYAFEFGWLDAWLKMGFFGLLSLLYLIWTIVKNGLKYWRQEKGDSEIYALLAVGGIFLTVTHFFTPYLNHPLGLGFVSLAGVILAQHDTKSYN